MPVTTIEWLKERFEVRDIPPYGPCLVVPGSDFNPDWEGELDVDVIKIDFGDPSKPFTLIPLKDKEVKAIPVLADENAAHVPKKKGAEGRSNLIAPKWSGEEEERLLKRIGELTGSVEGKCRQLTIEFPGRSNNSIHQKYIKLQQIKRKADKIKRPEPEEKKEERKEPKPPKSPKEFLTTTDLAAALIALVEAVGPENIQFNISIQIGSKASA